MRTHRPLDVLFPKTRQQVLATVLLHPGRAWYLSDLARELRVRPSSLQRELSALVGAGILERRVDGNRVYFTANAACPFLRDLQGLLTKTAGVADILRDALKPFADRIENASIYGSVARGEELATSDVDLLVVGSVGVADLAPALRESEGLLGRPVNVTAFSPEEFARKRRTGHHFVRTVLTSPTVFLLGHDADLVRPPGPTPRAAASDERTGTRRPAGRGRAGPARRLAL